MEIQSILRHYFFTFTKYFLVGILFIIGYNKCSSPKEVVIDNTREVIVRDTVVIVPKPERQTIYIQKVDTVFVQVQDTVVLLQTTFLDSTITATNRVWFNFSTFKIENTDFFYVIKRAPTRYKFIDNTFTKYFYREPPVPLLRLKAGAFTDFEEFYPTASLQIRDGVSFYYGYGVSTKSNLIGLMVPIR